MVRMLLLMPECYFCKNPSCDCLELDLRSSRRHVTYNIAWWASIQCNWILYEGHWWSSDHFHLFKWRWSESRGWSRQEKEEDREALEREQPGYHPLKCLDILHTSLIPKGGEFDQGLITWLILHQRPQYTPYMSLKKCKNIFLQVFIYPTSCTRCTEYNGDNKFLNNSVLENNSIFGIGYQLKIRRFKYKF